MTGDMTEGVTSVIHDIGYRHYQGRRLGRGYARRSLFGHDLRAVYGLGRPARAKVMPFILFGLMLVPAAGSVALVAMTRQPNALIPYPAFAMYLQPLVAIFLASQAPVVASHDVRFSVVPLYFSRPLRRMDYVVAKYGAFATGLFLLLAVPVTILYAGALVTRQKHLGDHTLHYLGGLAGCLLLAAVLAGFALVVAAFTPRRGFGVAAVMAVYLISSATVAVVQGIALHNTNYTLAGWAGMFTPFTLVDGVQVRLLGAAATSPQAPPAGMAGYVFALTCAAVIAGSIGILYLRFRKAGLSK